MINLIIQILRNMQGYFRNYLSNWLLARILFLTAYSAIHINIEKCCRTQILLTACPASHQ